MFCKYCGKEIADTSHFCSACGNKQDNINSSEIKAENNYVTDDTIRYELKPKFIFLYKLLSNFFSCAAFVFFLFVCCYFELNHFRNYSIRTAVGILSIIVFVIAIIKTIIDSAQYKKTKYNFFSNKLEYVDGFFNRVEKELKYTSIREITMKQNLLERLFNIGTIHIFTTASSGYANNNSRHTNMDNNGIRIHCVENVYEQYEKVKRLIDEVTN